jgi:hypothetical protein
VRQGFLVAASAVLIWGCEGMSQKVDASRQERCQRADWAQVGERDGLEGAQGMAERYSSICGDLFEAGPYQEGVKKGSSRRGRAPA